MRRNSIFILLSVVVLAFFVTASGGPVMNSKTEVKSKQDDDPEASSVIHQSAKSRNVLFYNTYITGETNDIKIEIDLYNTQFFNEYRYMLVPIKIINKSEREIYLNAEKDKIFLIFRRQTGWESYRLEFKNFSGKIYPGKDIQFAGRFGFKSYDERLGVEISLKFIKMIVDGLNSGKSKFKKNELTGMEKQMRNNSKGIFETGTLGAKLELEYKIIKR